MCVKVVLSVLVGTYQPESKMDETKKAPAPIVEHDGASIVTTLPEVFAALAVALPVVVRLFGSKKDSTVNSRDLHAALGVARNHSTWWIGAVKKHGLVEGVDYIVDRLDRSDAANWPAIEANGGKVPTVFHILPKVAAKIATFAETEAGEQVWNYMYAVTDAAHDAVVTHYKAAVAAEHRLAMQEHGAAKSLAHKLGHNCIDLALQSVGRDDALVKAKNSASHSASQVELSKNAMARVEQLLDGRRLPGETQAALERVFRVWKEEIAKPTCATNPF